MGGGHSTHAGPGRAARDPVLGAVNQLLAIISRRNSQILTFEMPLRRSWRWRRPRRPRGARPHRSQTRSWSRLSPFGDNFPHTRSEIDI